MKAASYSSKTTPFLIPAYLTFLFSIVLFLYPTVTRALIIGEYSILPAYTHSGVDSGLAADRNGDVWFVDPPDQIARLTLSGDLTVFTLPAFGSLTGGIALGPDGNIWYTREFPGKIGRITPAGDAIEFSALIDSPRRITAGPDGNLWFTGSNLVGRITPEGDVSHFSLPTSGSSPVGITAGIDGNLWFVEIAANQIGRITPNGVITEFPVLTPVPPGTSQLFSITAGLDGNLWFTESGKIGRITTAGVVTEFTIPTQESYCYGITAGPDGNIWFAVNNRHKIGRITTAGVFLNELSTPSPVSAPQHITTGPDGLMWFTESNTNKIGLISQDSVTNYFPLTSGNSWTYEKNGVGGFTRTVSPGVFNINGINTKRLQFSEGYQMYLTNDSNGIREHREYDPGPPATTVTLNPPFVLAEAEATAGVPVYSYGTASGSQGGFPFSLPYSGASTIEALEVVTVPAGKFRCARIGSTLNISGQVNQTNWVAKNVGVVKSSTPVGISYILESTNVINTTPDSFWFVPRTRVPMNTLLNSNAITVSGITAPASISITNGEYSVDGGNYTASVGTVTNGQSVTVRQTSSDTFYTLTTATLTIGSLDGAFNVRTWPKPTGAELANVILILQILAGIDPGTIDYSGLDVSGDDKIGLQDAIYILQMLAGLKQ